MSDAALLVAAAFSVAAGDAGAGLPANAEAIAAFGLIVATSIKSSQFPVPNLFLRSMEGASPNSALGYAGISAHAGIVLLAGTEPLWSQFEWAHALLAFNGALTVLISGTVANVRADRKGGIAAASSATLGALFIVLAAGYSDAALLLALGHASFRMNQARACNQTRTHAIIHACDQHAGSTQAARKQHEACISCSTYARHAITQSRRGASPACTRSCARPASSTTR